MKIRSPNDFRTYLQEQLIARCRHNPRYSLRAFAKSLSIDPSELSKLLSGRRTIGNRLIKTIGQNLGCSEVEIAAFQVNSNKKVSGSSLTGEKRYRQLSLDTFNVISDWYHFAILELIGVKGFQPSPRWVAKVLDLTTGEVNIALERLIRINLLKIDKKTGAWVDLSGKNTTSLKENITSEALRKHQRQVLQLAIGALDKVPIKDRDQTSLTLAIDKSKILAAKERIKEFRRDMDKLLSSGPNLEEVYNLSISLYPVSSLTLGGPG